MAMCFALLFVIMVSVFCLSIILASLFSIRFLARQFPIKIIYDINSLTVKFITKQYLCPVLLPFAYQIKEKAPFLL